MINMEKVVSKVFFASDEVQPETVAPGMTRKIMAYDENLMLVRVEFGNGAIGAVHSHPHSQISHVESGVFEVEIGGEKKMLTKGDAFYAPPGVLHGAVCLEAGVLIDVFSPMREDFIQTTNK